MRTRERRNVIFVSLLGFLVSLGFGIIAPIMPFYVEILGGGAFELGILLSSFMVTRALLARYFGRLSDFIGRKRIVVVGAGLYALLGYLFTLPGHWEGLILVRGLQGVASAMVWPVGEALVIDSSPEERRGTSLSIYIMASNLGFAAGPFAGGFLFWLASGPLGMDRVASFHFPFYFLAVFSALATVLVQASVQDVLPTKAGREAMLPWSLLRHREPEPTGPIGDLREARAEARDLPRSVRRQVNVLFLNNLGNGLSFSLVSFLPIYYMKDFLGLDEIIAGTLMGVAMSVGIAVNLPAGYFSDRFGRKPLVLVGGYLSRGATAFMPLTTSVYHLGALMVFRSFAFQVSRPALRALEADLFPEEVRGRLIGTAQTLFNLGAIFGAPLGGILYDRLKEAILPVLSLPGVLVPFLLSSILGIITTTLVLLYVRETRKIPVEKVPVPTEL